ncbi:YceI family protein [Marinobacterium stanieri]|uniref:Polyisoprenoid-binding protein YceI n=1 Tax=Marinobacterium stanieri TaxID=49186 RepID=A0A1N6WQG8_9GAMM|nr:YceI family protein [Marinobacterium stanieri]SIQ92252.1 Polyisoprenoid-binding protein YceI [Marinobacterium stanieri]
MKKTLGSIVLGASLALTGISAQAADYAIDTQGQHAFINFKISHLGFSWLYGRFNDFEGTFSWDAEAPEASRISVNIDPASVDSDHAERDKHLRSGDFLDVDAYPEASFVSTGVEALDNGRLAVTGDLTLHGVTKEVVIDAAVVGEGNDPWGNYRAGFEGTTKIRLADFGINAQLGPKSEEVFLTLSVEGIRQ